MKFQNKFVNLLLMGSILILAITACSPSGSGGNVEPDVASGAVLEGTSWVLAEFGPEDGLTAVLPDTTITLNFTNDGSHGSAGCNSYFGEFTQSGNSLTFGAIGSTKMACPEPIMQQENEYLAALGTVSSFALTDEQLTLHYDDGRLIFTEGAIEASDDEAEMDEAEGSQTAVPSTPGSRPESSELQGTSWILTSFGPNDNQTAVLPDTELTLNFDGEQINGSAGCNSYFADVAVEDGTLSVGLVGSTLMACMDEGVMQQESEFVSMLAEATRYTLRGNRLTLHTDRGSLQFVAATMHETGTEGVEVVDWETAVSLLNSGDVVEIFQTHSLDVTLTLADGRTIKTVEPAIDDIFTAVDDCGEPCSNILLATE